MQTICAFSQQVYGGMAAIAVFGHGSGQRGVDDLVDQFQRLAGMADGQKDYLQGTIDFYQTRATTKMTIAARNGSRSSPGSPRGHPADHRAVLHPRGERRRQRRHQPLELAIWLDIMLVMTIALLIWTKRLGWW